MVHPRPAIAVLLLLLGLNGQAPATPPAAPSTAPRKSQAPPILLWAWEQREDLRSLDPQQAGVAFLADRIFLGQTITVAPRRQPIAVPRGIYAEAVVRLEPTVRFEDSPTLRAQTAAALLRAASLPGIRGLEIDFDATTSQRPFYRAVVEAVRKQLPPGLSLTMTALMSWCAEPSGWLRQMPVDAAIPMRFRAGQHVGSWVVREPLCSGSLGLSIDEMPAAPPTASERIFLFAPHPWTLSQIAQINRGTLPFDSIATNGAK